MVTSYNSGTKHWSCYRSRQTSTSPLDSALRLMKMTHARLLSDTTHCPMVTSYNSGTKHCTCYRSRQTLNPPLNSVLSLMRTTHAKLLSDTTRCAMVMSKSVHHVTVGQNITIATEVDRLWLHRRTVSWVWWEEHMLDSYQTLHTVQWWCQSLSVM